MQETRGSTEAQERLESFFETVFSHFYIYFTWGYEFWQMDAHSWDAGCKYGYRLPIPEEYDRVHAAMSKVKEAVEALDFVGGVDVDDYEPDEAEDYTGLNPARQLWNGQTTTRAKL